MIEVVKENAGWRCCDSCGSSGRETAIYKITSTQDSKSNANERFVSSQMRLCEGCMNTLFGKFIRIKK